MKQRYSTGVDNRKTPKNRRPFSQFRSFSWGQLARSDNHQRTVFHPGCSMNHPLYCMRIYLFLVVIPHGNDPENVVAPAHQNFKHLQLNSKYSNKPLLHKCIFIDPNTKNNVLARNRKLKIRCCPSRKKKQKIVSIILYKKYFQKLQCFFRRRVVSL